MQKMIELSNIKQFENTIIYGDSSEILYKLPRKSVDLVITSPPYSDLRKYDGVGNTWNERKFNEIAVGLSDVLKDGGVIVWIVNDKTEKGSKTLTSFRQALYFQKLGFNINDVMIWEKTNYMPQISQPRYSDCFEYMFIFSKGKPKTFNPIMIPCKCAGQVYNSTTKNMGGENGRTYKEFNINKEKVKPNIWRCAVSQNKTRHPAVFPEQLIIDHILSWSNENDIVLDPFMGSGTTALACIKTNRKFIGIELNEDYVDLAMERIEESKRNDRNSK